MIKRELYLSKIRGFYDSDLVKVISGMRRAGKSVLLNQIIGELKQLGVKDNHIIFINFEDLTYADIANANALNRHVLDQIKDKNKYYLFFDEIQNVEEFEKVVNSLRATQNVSIFITGSNSKLLSGELATLLSGRYVSFRIMPFTFSEVCAYVGAERENREEQLERYLEWGGMPQLYNLQNESEYKIYIEDLYNSVVLKDIIERAKIKDVDLLNRILQFIIENVGGVFSANSIHKFLKSEKISASVEKIYNYVDKITASLIVNRVSRYNIRGKKVIQFYDKYYLTDLGLMQLKRSSFEKSSGSRLENIVYNELIARGHKVFIGESEKGEVDFIVDNFGHINYIQVAEYLSSEEVINREFGSLAAINDNYPKYVLSLDKTSHSRNGIHHLNLIDWLLSK
jgi:predicted AAA+ superfamily ATPase